MEYILILNIIKLKNYFVIFYLERIRITRMDTILLGLKVIYLINDII